MRLILIGDIHLYRLWAAPWTLLGKRLIGQCNLWLNRRHQFDRRLLAPVLQQAMSLEPDMLLFSGDLTTTALQEEFDDALNAISPLAQQVKTVIVPGNHDVYTFSSYWLRRMRRTFGELVAEPGAMRQLNDQWHLLALDSAVPRAISSRGLIGQKQLDEAGRQVEQLEKGAGLVVLCHYPPRKKPDRGEQKWQHRLEDADQFEQFLRACPGPVLLLHGHLHEPWHWQRTEPGLEHVVDICAGAPCQRTSEHPNGQGLWQIDLPAAPGVPGAPAEVSQTAQLSRYVLDNDPTASAQQAIWRKIEVS